MKLARKDYEFNNTRICYIMPKHIELDRVLINLYMLLKYDGRRLVARTGRDEVTVQYIVDQLIQRHSAELVGFSSHQDVVYDWIYSDLLDIVNRGIPDKEVVAAPVPLHINAYKLRNPKQATDYRGAEHIYSMIRAADPGLAKSLADYLGQGMSPDNEVYDGETPLDLDTLMIVRMVDNPLLKESASGQGSSYDPPLCICQARLMCNDLRRLLAYKGVVPRSVLIGYLRTAFGFHLGLHLLRLFHTLPGWVRAKKANAACLNCKVDPLSERPFINCPYAFQNPAARGSRPLPAILVDMGEDHTGHMAQLSRENCARHYSQINDYIQAVFTVNQLFRFADSYAGRRQLNTQPQTVADALEILAKPPDGLNHYFSERIDTITPPEDLSAERQEVKAIWAMEGLSPLEKFVQLVSLDRTRYYRKYLTEELDQVLMKNTETCLVRQVGRKSNDRRWYIGSRLLEMLVQIAVLQPVGQLEFTGFRSQPILIDQFVNWLRERYGLALMPDWTDATIQDYEAFTGNLRGLKNRLREIGFFTDLSDAYNAQTIRPRYAIKA